MQPESSKELQQKWTDSSTWLSASSHLILSPAYAVNNELYFISTNDDSREEDGGWLHEMVIIGHPLSRGDKTSLYGRFCNLLSLDVMVIVTGEPTITAGVEDVARLIWNISKGSTVMSSTAVMSTHSWESTPERVPESNVRVVEERVKSEGDSKNKWNHYLYIIYTQYTDILFLILQITDQGTPY